MNRSISKIRHIQRLNESLENRYLYEQDEDVLDLPSIGDDSNGDDLSSDSTYFQENCEKAIDMMEDIITKLKDCCEDEDPKGRYEVHCMGDVKELMEVLEILNLGDFSNDNAIGL
jgi:hypothetical protein